MADTDMVSVDPNIGDDLDSQFKTVIAALQKMQMQVAQVAGPSVSKPDETGPSTLEDGEAMPLMNRGPMGAGGGGRLMR